MDRSLALDILKKHISKENMIKHCLASEAVLIAIAKRLGKDEKQYGLCGLLHDLDVELTSPQEHGLKTKELLKDFGVDEDIIEAISLHNELASSQPRTKTLHHALASGETITGLITATALVYPEKKLEPVKAKSIKKRMKEKAFAASVNRDIILECETIGIPIDEFCNLSLNAMKEISADLDL